MAALAEQLGLLETGNVMGFFDESIEGPYSGWATNGVSWNQPSWGVAPHELGHTRGLKHFGCLDNNGDGEPDEVAGGAVDPKHPTGLPGTCSLAPIDPDGYFGITSNQNEPQIYSNDPTHPAAAYPFMSYKDPGWSDPYYNCKLLRAYGVDCRGAEIGVHSRQGPSTARQSRLRTAGSAWSCAFTPINPRPINPRSRAISATRRTTSRPCRPRHPNGC
jgi:hypothetical protein